MTTRKPEGPTYEEKVQIDWSAGKKKFDLLKTITAFANGDGGDLCILEFIGDERALDSARLHDFVSKYVEPPVQGITSAQAADRSWTISVHKSPSAPHIIKSVGNYQGVDGQKTAFHKGQIYVRHSSKTEPASLEDLQRLIREGVSSWLSSLGEAVARIGLAGSEEGIGIPFRLVPGGPALEVSFKDNHPYSASDLGHPHGKTGAWIGKLVNKENMRNDPKYTKRIEMYATPLYSYSDAAKERVAEILEENPDYNPYTPT